MSTDNPTPDTPDTPPPPAAATVSPPPAPQGVDPRRRMRELLSIPERDRTDAQWDELNELEIQFAPGNRINPGQQPGPVGVPRNFGQKKHPQKGENKGGKGGGGGGGGKNRSRPPHKQGQGPGQGQQG